MKSLPLPEWTTLEEAVDYLAEKLDERWTTGHVMDAGKDGLFSVRGTPMPPFNISRGIKVIRKSWKVNGKELEAYVTTRLANEKRPALTTVKSNKLRRDSLDPAIDKAISLAGNTKLADVYLQLKGLAMEEEKPFTGIVDGDALCYTNDNDEPDKLTKNALGKRLNRRSAKPLTAV